MLAPPIADSLAEPISSVSSRLALRGRGRLLNVEPSGTSLEVSAPASDAWKPRSSQDLHPGSIERPAPNPGLPLSAGRQQALLQPRLKPRVAGNLEQAHLEASGSAPRRVQPANAKRASPRWPAQDLQRSSFEEYWAKTLEEDEALSEDPWDGCEELAREGLAEWCQDFLHRRENDIDSETYRQLRNLSCSLDILTSDKLAECERISCDTASTTTGSRASYMSSRSSATRCSYSTQSSQPGVKGFCQHPRQASLVEQDADDWECEFMLRAALDISTRLQVKS